VSLIAEARTIDAMSEVTVFGRLAHRSVALARSVARGGGDADGGGLSPDATTAPRRAEWP